MSSQDKIRNFCIIAHIDHGKSTLADRFLEITGTVDKREMKPQLLDQMELERERGITIKLAPVRMNYTLNAVRYTLNLIDTPGHVDFTYEVSRSLACVEGAILLVDATQGVQAQTLANAYLALDAGVKLIPVVNKIDLPSAESKKAAEELVRIFGFQHDDILFASGKTGGGVREILEAAIMRIPPPRGKQEGLLRALIFDSFYEKHRGVIAYVRIMDGEIRRNDAIFLLGKKQQAQATEIGYLSPKMREAVSLSTGEIGYVVTGLRSLAQVRVGDTITLSGNRVSLVIPLPGYRESKPMVYASIFPESGEEYPRLADAIEKLQLNDAALQCEKENSPALGFGFRTGFLGLLHMEIVQERLQREFRVGVILTSPSVAYQVHIKGGEQCIIHSVQELPDASRVEYIEEPWTRVDVITPVAYASKILDIVKERRGIFREQAFFGATRARLAVEMPLSELITDFHDKLKSITAGYASMSYEPLDFRIGDLVRLDILVAGETIFPLSAIVTREEAQARGRALTEKLKKLIPRQQFEVAVQAAIGGRIVARETIPALRKDVTAKLYGGDVTRKMKLLEKQKKGKRRMKRVGKIDFPQEAFLEVLRR